MPKVRRKINGDFYIHTFRGDPNYPDEGYHGTWQLHAIGEEYLNQHRLLYDGADLSMDMFFDLAAWRYIWSETGNYPVPKRQGPYQELAQPPTATASAAELVTPTRSTAAITTNTTPAEAKVPLRMTINVTGTTWKVNVSVDSGPSTATTQTAIDTLLRSHPQAILGLGTRQLRSHGSLTKDLDQLGKDVTPQSGRLMLELIFPGGASGSSRRILGTLDGLNPNGSVFKASGEPLIGPPNLGERLLLIIRRDKAMSTAGAVTIPGLLSPRRYSDRNEWQCWSIVVPVNDDAIVTRFLSHRGISPPMKPVARRPSKKRQRQQMKSRWLARKADAASERSKQEQKW